MIKGIGVDIVDISSFKDFKRNRAFYIKVFSAKEIEYCISKRKYKQHFAGKFAAKEAVVKAFSGKVNLTDIEILNGSNGNLGVKIKGKKRNDVLVSVSHSRKNAVGFAVRK